MLWRKALKRYDAKPLLNNDIISNHKNASHTFSEHFSKSADLIDANL